jgi:hypothetical protein
MERIFWVLHRLSCRRLRERSRRHALLRRANVAHRQYAKAPHLRQVNRIGLVAAVLESIVFLDHRDVCQMHFMARRYQTIGQVVRRFRDHAASIPLSSFGSRRRYMTRSASSMTTTELLFECRSIRLNFISASVW